MIKKKPAKKKTVKKAKAAKPVGKVTHFYNHIRVAIVKFNTRIPAKTRLRFNGATTDFSDTPSSMQYDHKPITAAAKGKQIGIKVKKRVRDGDLVYREQ